MKPIDYKASCLNCQFADWVNISNGRCRALAVLPLAFTGGWLSKAYPYRECPTHQYRAIIKRPKLLKRKTKK